MLNTDLQQIVLINIHLNLLDLYLLSFVYNTSPIKYKRI